MDSANSILKEALQEYWNLLSSLSAQITALTNAIKELVTLLETPSENDSLNLNATTEEEDSLDSPQEKEISKFKSGFKRMKLED